MIYLDNAASTKPRKEVIDTMVCAMEQSYANADAIHDFGHRIFLKIKDARKTIGKYLKVSPERIFLLLVVEKEIILFCKELLMRTQN